MSLTEKQIASLLGLVARTHQEDCIDCDCCFDRLAEFAELQLSGRTPCEAMQAVKAHLDSCACCADEFKVLMDGLKAMGQGGCE